MTHQNPKSQNGGNKKTGRKPVELTEQLAAEICGRIADGQSLRSLSKLPHLPSASLITRWLAKGDQKGAASEFKEFRERYARAREASADAAYEEIMAIEKRVLAPKMIENPDYIAPEDGQKATEPKMIPNPEWLEPNAARVLIDSIKWRAGKMRPTVYGDRVQIDGDLKHRHDGPLDDTPAFLKPHLNANSVSPTLAALSPKKDDSEETRH